MDMSRIFLKGACPTPIGGQAVLEGVMMRGMERTAIAVRLPDGRILGARVAAALLTDSARVGTAQGETAVGWLDDDSQIWFRAHRPGEDSELRAKWDALESVRWTEAEA